MVGVPLGHHLQTGSVVCADPVSWFAQAGLIPNPSILVTGKPGLGKSTLIRRMATGLAAFGTLPLAFGDLKPDYAELVAALGGDVVQLGRGRGQLNLLDPGSSVAVARRLTGSARERLLSDARGRRQSVLSTIIAMNRGTPPADFEESVLAAALRVVDEHVPDPTLPDLVRVLGEGSEPLQQVTLAFGDQDRYRATVEPLQRSVAALVDGGLGSVFAGRTTTPIDLSRPVCIDISGIGETDTKLLAAVLLACWSEGFASIEALQALAEAGSERPRNFFVIIDELWRPLQAAGSFMGPRVDAILRTDRARGLGTAMLTHSIRDVPGGAAERFGMHAYFGVPSVELDSMRELTKLSDSEADLVTSWSAPEMWDPSTGRRSAPPGQGKVLLKVGSRPGIPVGVRMTAAEAEVNDTNRRWVTGEVAS